MNTPCLKYDDPVAKKPAGPLGTPKNPTSAPLSKPRTKLPAAGCVFFGGEQCSINFQGYMEGGAEEGKRAALQVLSAAG